MYITGMWLNAFVDSALQTTDARLIARKYTRQSWFRTQTTSDSVDMGVTGHVGSMTTNIGPPPSTQLAERAASLNTLPIRRVRKQMGESKWLQYVSSVRYTDGMFPYLVESVTACERGSVIETSNV